jgi:hypothetical protein
MMAGDELTAMNSGELPWMKSTEFAQLESPQVNSSCTDAQHGRAHLHGHIVNAGVASIDGGGR